MKTSQIIKLMILKPWTIRYRINEFRRFVIEKYKNDYLRPKKKHTDSNFYFRKYKNYKDYLNHQSEKFSIVENNLRNAYDRRLIEFEKDFKKILKLSDTKISSVLCLGARDGVEVHALRNLGYLAIGIDLQFNKNNKYVHYGDFHKIPYPSSVFDLVYTNCLDHCFDIENVFTEIKRVLRTRGKFLTDVETKSSLGSFESFSWSNFNDIINLLKSHNFKLQNSFNNLGVNGRKRFLFRL